MCSTSRTENIYYFVNNLLECDDDHCFCHHLFYVQSDMRAKPDEFSKVFYASSFFFGGVVVVSLSLYSTIYAIGVFGPFFG